MDNCSGIAVFQNNTTTLTTFTVFEESNRSLAPPWHAVFVVAYTIVFLVAISLNILMVLTACRKIREPSTSQGRFPIQYWNTIKAKDCLILCLLLSDIGFLLTVYFTAVDGLTKRWPFDASGPSANLVCKIVRAAPAVPVFCSTLILIIIAGDRYRTIVYSGSQQLMPRHVFLIAPTVLGVSLFMAYPVFHHTRIYTMNRTKSISKQPVSFCIEDWHSRENAASEYDPASRLPYSVFSMVFQFGIPFVIISATYFAIYTYIKKHRITDNSGKQKSATNKILLFQSLGFCISWFPLNGFGLLMDIDYDLFGQDPQTVLIVFFICHLLGLCSTLFNPIVYCYWNKAFKRELIFTVRAIKSGAMLVLSCLKKRREGNHSIQIQLGHSTSGVDATRILPEAAMNSRAKRSGFMRARVALSNGRSIPQIEVTETLSLGATSLVNTTTQASLAILNLRTGSFRFTKSGSKRRQKGDDSEMATASTACLHNIDVHSENTVTVTVHKSTSIDDSRARWMKDECSSSSNPNSYWSLDLANYGSCVCLCPHPDCSKRSSIVSSSTGSGLLAGKKRTMSDTDLSKSQVVFV